jgi:hypothetical protein
VNLGLKVATLTLTDHAYEERAVLKVLAVHELIDEIVDFDINSEIFNVMQWKSNNHVSDRTYLNLCKVVLRENFLKKLPRLNQIKKMEKRLATDNPVFRNEKGVYVDAKKKITDYLLKKYVNDANVFPKNKRIKVKISGDGTRVANNHIFNFTFSLMDFRRCTSASGNYSLGIFEIKETYEELKISLKEILENLRNLKEVKLLDEVYRIDFYLGGDMKFISLVLGLDTNFASGSNPCPWCKCSRKDFKKYRQLDLSITNPLNYARTLNEARESRIDGYVKEPLIDFIEFDHVIIDLLHLWLRITDIILLDLLQHIETIEVNKVWNPEKPEINIQFLKLKNFITSECKLKNPFYVQGKKFVFRPLSGTEREKIFSKLDLKNLYPNDESFKKRHEIVQNFYTTYCGIRDNVLLVSEIKILTQNFADQFVTLYGSSLTPYVHCFVSHSHEFRELHGDFNLFNQQGLEKLNDKTTMDYFRSTNRAWFKDDHFSNFLVQMMNKRNRNELCFL